MTIVRIKIDFSEISDQDGVWMLIDGAFKTIKDIEKQLVLSYRWLQGRNTISLFMKEFYLPSDESVLVLQSNDLVKVKYSGSRSDDPKHTNSQSFPDSLVPYQSSTSSSVCSLISAGSQVKTTSGHAMSSFPSSVDPSMAVSLTNKDGGSVSEYITSSQEQSSRTDVDMVTGTEVTNREVDLSREINSSVSAYNCNKNNSASSRSNRDRATESAALESFFNGANASGYINYPQDQISETQDTECDSAPASFCNENKFAENIVPGGMEEGHSLVDLDQDLVDLSEYSKDDKNNYRGRTDSYQKIKRDSKTPITAMKDRMPPQTNPLVSERNESSSSLNNLDRCKPEMRALEEAKKRRIDRILKRLGVYGELWEENQKYCDGSLYYEGGTPERMWLYPWTEGLEDLNLYIQVRYCLHPNITFKSLHQ